MAAEVADTALLCARGLGLAEGGEYLFKNVDLELNRGELAAVYGPVGLARTALLLCLLGRMRFGEGSLRVGETEVGTEKGLLRALRAGEAARNLSGLGFFKGVNDVRPGLSFAALVRAELRMFGKDADDDAVAAYLARWALSEYAETSFEKADVEQRVRLGIALGMVGEPAILALEDIECGMAPFQTRHIMNYLRNLAREGRCVIVGCVDPALARMADKQVYMREVPTAASVAAKLAAEAAAAETAEAAAEAAAELEQGEGGHD